MAYVLDIECYKNYFLAMFVDIDTKRKVYFEMLNDVRNFRLPVLPPYPELIYTFNGWRYDRPMIQEALNGATCGELKSLSDKIIENNLMPWDIHNNYDKMNHVDIINVLPGIATLKIYGGRIGTRKIQDLPIHPSAIITKDQSTLLREYCVNDCIVTAELVEAVKPQLSLREKLGSEYGMDLRSKSDAQIAETVITSEVTRLTGRKVYEPNIDYKNSIIKVSLPKFITDNAKGPVKELVDLVLSEEFKVKASTGQVILPKSIEGRLVNIGDMKYKIGIGGLHSVDTPGSFKSDGVTTIKDIDVTSYYPSIILNSRLAPRHIGDVFLNVYGSIVAKRLAAKKAGDKVTADALKITINGSYGKLGSQYSKLYDPELLITVTLTGQLALLMLIYEIGPFVISANTDGIMLQYDRWMEPLIKSKVIEWEHITGYRMEETEYRSVHRRDVNNYVAITTDNKLKVKGIFANEALDKNPVNLIVFDAIKQNLLGGTPIEDTIRSCTDPYRFTTLRTVNGGAEKDGVPIGKSIRWYYSNVTDTAIHYVSNGNMVPRSMNGVPLQELPAKLPVDLDLDWYINEANNILKTIS